ncbi:MAG: hypothetical protein IPM57_02595 [Oligoflexia bacterium]|nr:hypothetical protein [Oligoflexia bacterium]
MKPFLFVLILLTSLFSFAEKKLILKLVAKVDQKMLTSRDVESHYIVEQLYQDKKPELPLKANSDAFKIATDQVVIETMVFSEAQNFSIAKIEDEELDKAFNKIKKKIAENKNTKEAWSELNYTEDDLKKIVERQIRVEKLIKYKTESSFSQVTDEEARAYYNKNRLRFGTMSFESFKPSIKKFISKRNSEERLREWFDVLKRKYKVRTLI